MEASAAKAHKPHLRTISAYYVSSSRIAPLRFLPPFTIRRGFLKTLYYNASLSRCHGTGPSGFLVTFTRFRFHNHRTTTSEPLLGLFGAQYAPLHSGKSVPRPSNVVPAQAEVVRSFVTTPLLNPDLRASQSRQLRKISVLCLGAWSCFGTLHVCHRIAMVQTASSNLSANGKHHARHENDQCNATVDG